MRTYGAAQLLAETVGVSPDDVFINLVEVQGRTGPSEREFAQFVPQAETKWRRSDSWQRRSDLSAHGVGLDRRSPRQVRSAWATTGRWSRAASGPSSSRRSATSATSSPTPALQESRSSKSMCTWLTSR